MSRAPASATIASSGRLIACLTGFRVGETAQLTPDDVTDSAKDAEGIWMIKISQEGGKRVKAGTSGERLVPVLK
jgi:integrase